MNIREQRLKELGFENYDEFLGSAYWKLRKDMFYYSIKTMESCADCHVLRWICRLIYGQDLNLHHKTYEHIGCEPDEDLELLCERCHQLRHFGKSNLPEIKLTACRYCRRPKLEEFPDLSFRPVRGLEFIQTIVWRFFVHYGERRRRLYPQDNEKILDLYQHPGCERR